MSRETVIATRALTKRYGRVVAVDGLELNVQRGEVYGFLGRNGAGKTTTIRMLLGLVRPTAGEVQVLGRRARVDDQRWLGRVGCLVETATAYPNLTVRENLEVQRRLTGASRASVADVIDRLRLQGYADRRAGRLSLGNKQRLALARALVHSPEVLVLDEPANALDPAGIVEIRDLLRSLADEQGVTVFMSSHILAEVARLVDRVGIVHAGRLVEELDRDELVARARAYSAEQLTDAQRADALLGLELERYFLARTGGQSGTENASEIGSV
jgi:ABC-2 type transport system ATP-binding protein